VTANKTEQGEIFFIAEGYRYDKTATVDDLRNNINVFDNAYVPLTAANDREMVITGVLRDADSVGGLKAVEGLDNISRLKIKDAGTGNINYTNGHGVVTGAVNLGNSISSDVKWAMKMDAPQVLHGTNYYEKKGDPYLWQYQATPYAVGNNSANGYFWFTTETVVINNSGALQQVEDFTKSSLDPFTILKNSAGEAAMSIKKSNNNGQASWISNAAVYADIKQDDMFAYTKSGAVTAGIGTNIDLVFVPDLLLAAVQRILPAITNLNK
jgi:hypothetical protein